MTEHLTEQEVSLFRSRTIRPLERKRVDSHVVTCESCLHLILPSEDMAVAYSEITEAFLTESWEEPFHLSNKELELYAGETADPADRIIAESHLEICELCNGALRALVPGSLVSRQSLSQEIEESDIAQKRPFNGWHPAALITPARTIAAALFIVCLLVTLFVWQQRHSRTKDQTAHDSSSQTPALPQPGVSPISSEAGVFVAEKPISDQSGITVSLKDNGREIGLDRAGNLIGLEEFREASRSLVREALTAKSLARPVELDELTSPSITLMDPTGGEDSFGLLGPSGPVTMSNHPTLHWQPLKGATSYTVSVFDADFNRVARSSPQTATQWTTPKLGRGMIYSWEVVAARDGQEVRSPVAPAPRAQFRILAAVRLTGLMSQKQHQPVSHLVLGLMYARFGLLAEAEEQLQTLAKQNPDSPVAKRLLRTVREWRNR